MTTALTRPLIARKLVDVARMEGATAVAHGCAATSDDGIRLDTLIAALDPALRVIVPTRMWDMTREEATMFANEHSIPPPASSDAPYKTDANVWGRSTICSACAGSLDGAFGGDLRLDEICAGLSRRSRRMSRSNSSPGDRFASNNIEMLPLEMIESVETIAGLHGVGRIDLIATRLTGGQAREIYEAPAAVVLHAAHRELQQLVMPSDLEQVSHALGRTYADLINGGQWFSPTRTAIDAFVAAVQPRVTGSIRLKLFKGDCRVAGRRSPYAQTEAPAAQASAPASSSNAAGHGTGGGPIKLHS